jgi:hypothetical protein
MIDADYETLVERKKFLKEQLESINGTTVDKYDSLESFIRFIVWVLLEVTAIWSVAFTLLNFFRSLNIETEWIALILFVVWGFAVFMTSTVTLVISMCYIGKPLARLVIELISFVSKDTSEAEDSSDRFWLIISELEEIDKELESRGFTT